MPMSNNHTPSIIGAASARFRRWRAFKDKLARVSVTIGGLSAIFAILLIFVYLMYEVIPIFKPASVNDVASYDIPASTEEKAANKTSPTIYLSIEEQAEVGLRVSQLGQAVFFETKTGRLIDSIALPIEPGVTITSVSGDVPAKRVAALGLSNGRVMVIRYDYTITYPNDKRLITPSMSYPYGQAPLAVVDTSRPVLNLVILDNDKALMLVAEDDKHHLHINQYKKNVNALTEEVTINRAVSTLPLSYSSTQQLLISENQRWVFVINEQRYIDIYDAQKIDKPVLNDRVKVSDTNPITNAQFLLGGTSLLLGDSAGNIEQWFMVRDKQNAFVLKKVRSFKNEDNSKVLQITTEQRRKGFLTINEAGQLGIYNSTAHRQLLSEKITDASVQAMALSPRANALLVATDKKITFWDVENEHPDVSWAALWEKVWYEGYEKPDYIWQSSASNNDFEPKFSLMPLAFGTLKAAFYAMLFATPLAICAAIYTAYFMAPWLRRKVKPTIELMAALPSVILGFLAGLWLAPYVEKHLIGIFCLFIIIPIGVLLFAYLWHRLLAKLFHSIPDGWDAIILVPVVLFLGWLSLSISAPIEDAFFNGDIRMWLSQTMGVTYDQRNALIVGLAMGFAVVPIIFSIAEDAIFSVPKHLSYGSLALGATPWQTLAYVVLLTASPGIFSAVMIGMGRAVGETMIVLMATGNTPLMDVNIFQGMRTLAANIAVEMPETEVGSTHYRILFLAALVLFMFTFVVNTLAELVRQRLRKRYESL